MPVPDEVPRRVVLALTNDRIVLDRLEQIAGEFGIEVHQEELAAGTGPVAVVLDLERPRALDDVASWRRRQPAVLLAGHLATPSRDLWLAAQRAGCDLVANRGALAAQLRRKLLSWRGPERPRHPLFEVADAAGRLGLVHRAEDTPVGPIAVYRVGSQLVAVADVCPHAGARLSSGELEEGVVTCPRHGSRFDLRTGERLRGPADLPLQTFPLLEHEGYLHLVLPS
jgi:nitrite reductase/ring-hydroxylating ferredoxin subunit